MYTDLQLYKVPPGTIARIRTCPIPEQPFPHKFTDNTAEGCQVSNYMYHHGYNIFFSQINKGLHSLCPFLKLTGKQKFAWTNDFNDQLIN